MGVQDESIPCPPRALELHQSREESRKKAVESHEGTKLRREDAKKIANKAAQRRANKTNCAKAKSREEPRGITQIAIKVVAEQEPKGPSLCHTLEGENKLRRAAHQQSCEDSSASRATERRRATKTRRKPRNAAMKAASCTDADKAEGNQTKRWIPHT